MPRAALNDHHDGTERTHEGLPPPLRPGKLTRCESELGNGKSPTGNVSHDAHITVRDHKHKRRRPGRTVQDLPRPVPPTKSNLKKNSRRSEREQEHDTVRELIHTMRHGGEVETYSHSRSRSHGAKNARIEGGGLRVRWARFKKRLGTGSTLSDSLPDESTDSVRSPQRMATGRGSTHGKEEGESESDDDAEVDQVVVDNVPGTDSQVSELERTHSASGKDAVVTNAKSHTTSFGTVEFQHPYGFWESNVVLTFLRWRVYPFVRHFFEMRFNDGSEPNYNKEAWWSSKSLGLYCSLFFIIDWILILALSVRPFALADMIFYYGAGPLLTIPLPFFIIYDFPYLRPLLYQVYVFFTVWSWAIYLIAFMYVCDFYAERLGHSNCGQRDFTSFFFLAIAFPAIAMFGLRLSRLANVIGAAIFFIITCVLILPEHASFARNVINFFVFHVFLLYIHYKRESTERRNYALRSQLKVQFRATQKAQVNERTASDSKRRLTSYVFHEVRVPLNTALLAVQNMEATGIVSNVQEIEWTALIGSLSMMSKVLNDVLDFDRLDSGRFSTVNTPYNLHQTIRSILVPLRLAADARGLTLSVELDNNIDQLARRAALAAQGHDSIAIAAELAAHTDKDGLVLGDEMRLRQILNNLASNACKFTPAGGQIRIVTRLVIPALPSAGLLGSLSGEAASADTGEGMKIEGASIEKDKDLVIQTNGDPADDSEKNIRTTSPRPLFAWRRLSIRRKSARERPMSGGKGAAADDALDKAEKGELSSPASPTTPLSIAQLVRHNSLNMNSLDRIVVRVEVHDTGVGIRKRDLVDHKLFSPYVQTEIGKYQGGKGTGLGLALVRRIVKLSGGRLGVKSKLGHGSTFWVELPLGIGEKTLGDANNRPDILHDGSDYSDGQRQLALRLEGLKFARAIGEGDTPSTTMIDQDHITHSTFKQGGDVVPTSSPPPAVSERTLKGLMDQSGRFELVSQPLLKASMAPPGMTKVPSPESELVAVPTAVFAPLSTPLTAIPTKPQRIEPQTSTHLSDSTLGEATFCEGREEVKESRTSSAHPPLTGSSVPASTPLAFSPAPAPSPAQAPSTVSHVPARGRPSHSLRVLVVDDDLITRSLMSRMLTRLGCMVTLAENGKIALEKILGGALPPGILRCEPGMPPGLAPAEVEATPTQEHVYLFDVVFLDNQMPIMSGLDTVTVLRSLGRKDFVIGVTGNALLSDQQEYLSVGVDHVLTKPVLEASLTSMLHVASQCKINGAHALQESPLHP